MIGYLSKWRNVDVDHLLVDILQVKYNWMNALRLKSKGLKKRTKKQRFSLFLTLFFDDRGILRVKSEIWSDLNKHRP